MSNQYTVDILNADRLVVQGKEVDPFTLGTLVTADVANNIGIRVDAPQLSLDISGTDGIRIPRGSSAFRNAISATTPGILRYNTDTNQYEARVSTGWKNFLLTGSGGGSSDVAASFLVDANSETQLELKRNNPTTGVTQVQMTPAGAGGPTVYGGTIYPDWRIINGFKSGANDYNYRDVGLYFQTSFRDLQNSGTEVLKNVMFLNVRGNVGIGTQIPTYMLDIDSTVTDNLKLKTSNSSNWSCFQNSTRTWKLGQDGTNFVLKLDNGTNLGSVTLSNKMSVTQDGHLMLGGSNDTSTSRLISALYGDAITVGSTKYICFGKALSSGNQVELAYYYAGSASDRNQLGIGFYGNPNVLNVTFKERVGINVKENSTGSDNIKAALHIKTSSKGTAGDRDNYILFESWRSSTYKYGFTSSGGSGENLTFTDYTESRKEFRGGTTSYYKNIFSYAGGSPGTVTFDTAINTVSYANLDNSNFTFFKGIKKRWQSSSSQEFQMTFKGSGGEDNAVQFYTITTTGGNNTRGPAYIFYTNRDSSNKVTIYKNSRVRIGSSSNTADSTHYLYVHGSVSSSGTTLTSDDRLKHNEVNVTNALGIINKLNIKRYFKTQELYGRNHHFTLNHLGQPINDNGELAECTTEIGIIAQEIKSISELEPFISGEEVVNEEETPLGLDYNSIFSCGLAATQELDKKHNLLQYYFDKTKTNVGKNTNNILNNKQLIESLQQELNTANQTIQTLTQEKNTLENKVNSQQININELFAAINEINQRINN